MKPSKITWPTVVLFSGIICLSTAAYAYYSPPAQKQERTFPDIIHESSAYAPETQILSAPTPTHSPTPTSSPAPTPTPTPEPTPTPIQMCRISVSYSAKLADNNHVGNEWGYDLYVGSERLERGSTYSFQADDSYVFTIKCYATEYDSINDNGSSSVKIDVADLTEGKTTITQDVIVRENRGRYSGNTACWTFTITLKKAYE